MKAMGGKKGSKTEFLNEFETLQCRIFVNFLCIGTNSILIMVLKIGL